MERDQKKIMKELHDVLHDSRNSYSMAAPDIERDSSDRMPSISGLKEPKIQSYRS